MQMQTPFPSQRTYCFRNGSEGDHWHLSFSKSLNILNNGSYRLDHLKTKSQKLYFRNSKKFFHRFLDWLYFDFQRILVCVYVSFKEIRVTILKVIMSKNPMTWKLFENNVQKIKITHSMMHLGSKYTSKCRSKISLVGSHNNNLTNLCTLFKHL